MPTQQASFYCPRCNQHRLFTKQGVNHLVHALVSLFLCGLWLPVWIIASMGEANIPYFCSQCGLAGSPSSLRNQIRCNRCGKNTLSNSPNCIHCGFQFVTVNDKAEAFLPLSQTANNYNFYKIGAIVLAVFIIAGGIFFAANQVKQNKDIELAIENPIETAQLKKDFATGFSKLTWYSHVKQISVKPEIVEINTDFTNYNSDAKLVCETVSSIYYRSSPTNQNKKVKLFDYKGFMITMRSGILDKC